MFANAVTKKLSGTCMLTLGHDHEHNFIDFMLGSSSHQNKAVVITPFQKIFFSMKQGMTGNLVSAEKRNDMILNILVSIKFVICVCFSEINLNLEIRTTEVCKRFVKDGCPINCGRISSVVGRALACRAGGCGLG